MMKAKTTYAPGKWYKHLDWEKSFHAIIGAIQKNAHQIVKVEFVDGNNGMQFFDVRVWQTNPEGYMARSSKGICMKVDSVPNLINLLQKLQEYVNAYNLQKQQQREINKIIVKAIKEDNQPDTPALSPEMPTEIP